jgi:hypothetical protein
MAEAEGREASCAGREAVTEATCHRVSAEAARGVRGSAIGFNCTAGALVATLEALGDAGLSLKLRETRSQELYCQFGELHRVLAALGEGVLPPAVSGDLVLVEGDPLDWVPVRRWLGWRPQRRPGWGSALGGLGPPSDRRRDEGLTE